MTTTPKLDIQFTERFLAAFELATERGTFDRNPLVAPAQDLRPLRLLWEQNEQGCRDIINAFAPFPEAVVALVSGEGGGL